MAEAAVARTGQGRNHDATGLAAVEREATECRREIQLVQQEIENSREARSTAVRNRAAASVRGDDAAFTRHTAEIVRSEENIVRVERRLKLLQERESALCRQINEDAERRAGLELRKAQERAESELRDVSQRLHLARATVNELEQRHTSLRTRIQILRSADHPGAVPLDAATALQRAKAFERATANDDDREVVELKDGRRARLVGYVGVAHDAVVEIEGTRERVTVSESQIVSTRAAAAVAV